MKSRCFTQIPKHELVRMVSSGLNFSIHTELVNISLRDMAQLINKARRIEQIKYEKEIYWRFEKPTMKEKVSYIGSLISNFPKTS